MRQSNPLESIQFALNAAITQDLPTHDDGSCPNEFEVSIAAFDQLWPATSLGYGGFGGRAMTYATTVIVMHKEIACVYFGARRGLAYKARIDERFEECLKQKSVPRISEAADLLDLIS